MIIDEYTLAECARRIYYAYMEWRYHVQPYSAFDRLPGDIRARWCNIARAALPELRALEIAQYPDEEKRHG